MASNSSAADQARDNLRKIEHFVVLMLENRSFDQMLGHLELEEHDVDGVKPAENKPLINWYNGEPCKVSRARRTALTTAEDPCHEGWCAAEQLSTDYDEDNDVPIENGGFVKNFAATHPAAADPSLVMEYFTAEQVPVYNYLAQHFAYAIAGSARCRVLPGRTGSTR